MGPRRVTVVLFAALVLSGATLSRAAVSSIAAARALPADSVVSIRGTVTVPAGSFASSTFDQGFGLQDATGGIYITMEDNAGLTAGRHVRVTGTLGDDGYGLVVLRVAGIADVRRVAGTADPAPLPAVTGSLGEATEEADSLREDLTDLRESYRVQIEMLLQRLARAEAHAAAAQTHTQLTQPAA